MEFMFSDTVTRLSTRVVQLENRHKNNEQIVNRNLDDCGGALDFDSLSVASTGSKLTNSRLQPGGRIRVPPVENNSNKSGTGLVYSASTESVIGQNSNLKVSAFKKR